MDKKIIKKKIFYYLLSKNLVNYSEKGRVRIKKIKKKIFDYLLPKTLVNYSEKERVRIKKL